MNSTEISTQAHNELLKYSKKIDAALFGLINQNGKIAIEKMTGRPLQHFLAKTIVGQQLSTQAARTIWARAERQAEIRVIAPENLSHSELKSCGISRSKCEYIAGLRSTEAGQIFNALDKSTCSYDELRAALTSLKGIGSWSADMAAIFYFGMTDVWPTSDAALIGGMRKLLTITADEVAPVASHCSPYRSYLARHIWMGIDQGRLNAR